MLGLLEHACYPKRLRQQDPKLESSLCYTVETQQKLKSGCVGGETEMAQWLREPLLLL